jgi:hypothetical protein
MGGLFKEKRGFGRAGERVRGPASGLVLGLAASPSLAENVIYSFSRRAGRFHLDGHGETIGSSVRAADNRGIPTPIERN